MPVDFDPAMLLLRMYSGWSNIGHVRETRRHTRAGSDIVLKFVPPPDWM